MDDPRLGHLLDRAAVANPLAKIGLIGYSCDEGVSRNNGRIGSARGPDSFRKYFRRLGTAFNPEYDVDLSQLEIRDLGDVDIGSSLELTHLGLLNKVEKVLEDDFPRASNLQSCFFSLQALQTGFIPIIIGGGNDQSFPNARALINHVGGGIGVVNIDAHLDVRPLKGDPPTLAHSGSPFRLLLEDEDFQKNHGVFVEFACQGSQCSKKHADYVNGKGGTIHWLSDIRRKGDVVEEFTKVLSTFGDRPIFVSFDIDSIQSAHCPGVSCPGTIGLTAEEALGICRAAGLNEQVRLIDFSEYNPAVEEDRTGRLLMGSYSMEYSFDVLPVAIDSHPTMSLIGIGFMDGSVRISSYSNTTRSSRKRGHDGKENSQLLLTDCHVRHHKRPVRNVRFTPYSGDHLMVVTQNRALCQWDVETGRKVRCIRVAHEDRPYALHCVSDYETATGDEAGIVKLWDWRIGDRSPCVVSFDDVHEDIINDFTTGDDKKTLLAVSGDGTLSSFNLKNRKAGVQSEVMHAELLAVTVTRNGTKVICGSGEGGYVEVFNWNEFGNITERMQTGHEDAVDCLVNIDRSGLVASASQMDGSIRLIKFGKNEDLGVIGSHEKDRETGVFGLSVSCDDQYLISCGQDQKVKFWNLEEITRRFTASQNDDGDRAKSGKKKHKKKGPSVAEFFDDLAEEDNAFYDEGSQDGSDEDEDDDDDQ